MDVCFGDGMGWDRVVVLIDRRIDRLDGTGLISSYSCSFHSFVCLFWIYLFLLYFALLYFAFLLLYLLYLHSAGTE